MFPRVTDVKYKDKVYQYLRVVESYRDRRGKVRQRIVWNIGRLDKLIEEGKLDKLVEELSKFCKKKFVVPGGDKQRGIGAVGADFGDQASLGGDRAGPDHKEAVSGTEAEI